MSKKILKRSLALGALMAFVITGSAMAAETIVVGNDASANSFWSSDTSIVVGSGAKSKDNGVVIAHLDNMAVGKQAQVHDSSYAIALGTFARVQEAHNGIAVGSESYVEGENSIALGNRTYVGAGNSVALGAESSVNEANVISVGHRAYDIYHASGSSDNSNIEEYGDILTRRIVNVADGIEEWDAATVGQLNKKADQTALDEEVTARESKDSELLQKINEIGGGTTDAINSINQRLDRTNGKINKVGAGAAALAALHPLDYDPDDKLTFSAGMGNYAGENAAALGAFYRPNEKVMFSLGGTMGNGENMVNLGVSFALDKANGLAKMSKKELIQKVNAMEAENENMKAEMAELKALVAELVAKK